MFTPKANSKRKKVKNDTQEGTRRWVPWKVLKRQLKRWLSEIERLAPQSKRQLSEKCEFELFGLGFTSKSSQKYLFRSLIHPKWLKA